MEDWKLGNTDSSSLPTFQPSNAEDPRISELGRHILVLGGGNVAIDVARSAVRLGCQVSMACLESREAMPSHPWEIQAAEEEGVVLYPGRTFERILSDDQGRASGVECMQVSSFGFDETGRLNVEKVPGSNHILPCDTVIFSVGQRAGLAFIPDDAGVGLTSRKTIAINPNTFAATRPGVFAAGDSVSGTAFVIEAVDSGHKAAGSIIRYLSGQTLEPAARPELPVVRLSSAELEVRLARGEIHRSPRVPLPLLSASERMNNFMEVEGGYDDPSAQSEAARCLACGVCSECMSCTFACGVNAIDHNMVAQQETIHAGAIILAPGYQAYHAELSEEYGYGRFPNVVTSLQFERLLSASGPTMGHVHRPSDHHPPKRIAFLQCIGSRDQSHDYCSAVCCMYATKEAVIAKEHQPGLDVHVFMMDMRAFSKGYWSYFERARERYGVYYHRSRVSALKEDPDTHNLALRYMDENGALHDADFDMVILSVGMEISQSVRDLGRQLGVELDEYGFCHTVQFNPLETSRPGIFAAGPFREPKDIPESVVEASGAASAAATLLASSRFTLTTQREFPPERQVAGEAPRVGVFVCSCGSNIGGFVDVPAVTDSTRKLPNVVHCEWNLYTCSQDSIRHITEQVEEHQLNRVVVASCTPLTHQPLFQDSIRAAGLNTYLFEMANIRNQCSWVHSQDKKAATRKSIDLVRMAVARAALLAPQYTIEVPVKPSALVVGGGVAGMTAALALADQGFPVHLVEQSAELGGNLSSVHSLIPRSSPDGAAPEPRAILDTLVGRTSTHPNIQLYLESRVVASTGFMGNFSSTIQKSTGERLEAGHGVTILATGAQEYRGPDYGFGSDERILTQLQLETFLEEQPEAVRQLRSVAIIQCVGPAEKFCSRICCSVGLKNALRIKKMNPAAEVVVLHQDIRTYGFKERLYSEARRRGVIFVRYEADRKPVIEIGGTIDVRVFDPGLRRDLRLQPDLVVLSMPVVPRQDAPALAGLFKVARDVDGFFQEAHVKLRPVDFASDGIFMAGMAHYPKLLDETMIQAQAAAARAARVLNRTALMAGGRVAVVDPQKCTGCLTCVRICPFGVPKVKADLTGVGGIIGAAYIEAAVCQGCGSCVAECPARAIQLMHYTDEQMLAKVDALLETVQVSL